MQMQRLADLTIETETRERARAFTRYAAALAMTKGDAMSAASTFAARWPQSRHLAAIRKAAVPAGGSQSGSWGAPLAETRHLGSAFLKLLRPATVLGQLQAVRRAPLNVSFPAQTAGALVGWVGQGAAVRASALAFNTITLRPTKIAGIVGLSDELVRSSDPAAEELVASDLAAGCAQFADEALLDPARAEVADISPASITNGATPIASTGADADAVIADLQAAFAAIVASGARLIAPVIVMRPGTALHLAGLQTAGSAALPNAGVNGGTIWGVPVIVSASVGNRIVVLDSAELIAAEDSIDLISSEAATVELDTEPTNPPSAASKIVSMCQMNITAVMARLWINWRMRRAGAVAYVSGVTF